jgi:hypothetical protein
MKKVWIKLSGLACLALLGLGFAACSTWGINGAYGWNQNDITTGGNTSTYRENQLGGALYTEGDYWGQSLGGFTGNASLYSAPTEILGFSYGFSLRFPIKLGPVYLFPTAGADYHFFLDNAVQSSVTAEASAHNGLGVKFGGGVDLWLLKNFYIRAAALYNIYLENPFELAEAQAGNSVGRRMGPVFQLGIGGTMSTDAHNDNSIGSLAGRALEKGRLDAAQARWDAQDEFNLQRVGAAAELTGVNMPWVQKNLTASAYEVWFKLESAIGDNLAFETDGSTDTYMELYDARSGSPLASDNNGGSDNNARIIFNVAANTNYLIKIRGNRNTSTGTAATGRFRFHVIKYQAPAVQAPQAQTSPSPNQSSAAAQGDYTEMTINTTYRNTFSSSSRIHIYSLEVPAGYRSVTIYTEGSLDTRIVALNTVGLATVLANGADAVNPQDRLGSDDDSGDSLNARLTIPVPQGRDIYYVVGPYSDSTMGSYTITTQGSR